MATKARHLKTPMQLWVADNRKRLGLSSADLATLTEVTTDTARGWESRGSPSQDAVDILVRRFGVPAPTAMASSGDATRQSELAALLESIRELVALLRPIVEQAGDREARLRAVEAELESLRAGPKDGASSRRSSPRSKAG